MSDLFDSEDFPDIDSLDFDSPDPEVPTKKRKGLLKAILSGVAFMVFLVVIVSLAIGGVAYVAQQNTPPPEEPQAETVTIQYVNTEQVIWADQLCIMVASWQSDEGLMPEFSEPASSNEARLAMAKNLRENADIVSGRAEDLAELPLRAHTRAEEAIKSVTVADNDRVVSQGMDPNVYSSTQRLTSALNAYAASLRDMAADLEGLASYDPYGIRTQISRISTFFGEMNQQLGVELSEALTAETFSNPVTIEAAASLETCNGSLIDSEKLDEELGDELDTQRVAREFVTTNRCDEFAAEYATMSSNEEVARNLASCSEYNSSVTVNSANPVLSARIDERDAERAKPELPSPPITQTTPTEGASTDEGGTQGESPDETDQE